MALIIIAVVVAIGLFRLLKKMSNWGDDAYGTLEIRDKHPMLWAVIITPVKWTLRLLGFLVLLGMGWLGLALLIVWMAWRASKLYYRWQRFIGHHEWNEEGIKAALKKSAMRLAVNRSIETAGLETKRAGTVVRPWVLDVDEVARPDGRAYGHKIRIMSATGGGSLQQILVMIGKSQFDDAWTSEVRSNLYHLAGYRQDLRTRRPFGMLAHPAIAWLGSQGELPGPKRSKLSVTAEHEAGEGDLMVVYDDPLTDFLPYPYQPGWWAWHCTSQSQARPLGRWDDGTEATMSLTERRVLNQGAPGSGKSSWMDSSLRFDVECYDVFTVYIDLKGGMHGWVWEEGVGLFLSRPEDVVRFYEHAYTLMYREMNRAMGVESKKTSGTPSNPFLRIYMDEPSELPTALVEKRKLKIDGEEKETIIVEDVLRLSRALGWDQWWATQHASSERFPRGALVSLDTRITGRMVDQAGAQNSQGGGQNNGVSAARIPDLPVYKGAAVLSDESGLARMAKGYFGSDDDERLRAAKVSAMRHADYKPKDIWGFRDAAFKGRRIISMNTPGPSVPPPLAAVPDSTEDEWDDEDDTAAVEQIWDALDLVAEASSGPKVGIIRAEHFINDSGITYERAVKRARGNLDPARGGSEERWEQFMEALSIVRQYGLDFAKANARPKKAL